MRQRGALLAGLASLVILLTGISSAGAEERIHAHLFHIPGTMSTLATTVGPDGAIWFAMSGNGASALARKYPNGPTRTAVDLDPFAGPADLTVGPDHNIWFTETGSNKIGRLGRNGDLAEFSVPTPNAAPFHIAVGPDSNLWFTEAVANAIGRITPTGVVTEFALPTTEAGVWDIAAGSDGRVWFTEFDANAIGRISSEGVITEFPVPTILSEPIGIAAGLDGNIWFTENLGDSIGRVTPDGSITEFHVVAYSAPYDLIQGPGHEMWFTGSANPGRLGHIDEDGRASVYPLPVTAAYPHALTFGPDGRLWFVNFSNRVLVAVAISDLS